MSFVATSKKFKADHIEKWQEVLANFMVDPQDYAAGTVSRPYGKANDGLYPSRGIVLKDAETHKAIMTLASHLVGAMFGDRRGEYVHAQGVGWEDTVGSGPTVTGLMRYFFNMSGQFRTLVEMVTELLLFGTSVVEIGWLYREREQLARTLDNVDGIETDTFRRIKTVAYNDPVLRVIGHEDFFPDPSEARIEDMIGVAKRFKIDALRARALGKAGVYDKSAVERAIGFQGEHGDTQAAHDYDESFRDGIDRPEHMDKDDHFKPMDGVEYWGDVPWSDDDESSRRVITIVNQVVVRDDPFPFADPDLPFRSLVINPVHGRFYGVSPAEVIRWDQSLQDAVKILLAEAIIRTVHPPIIYDMDSELDVNRVRRWTPDMPIAARGGASSVGALKYDANVFNGIAEANMLKQSMQEASGATSVIQGQGLQHSRASATEAQFTTQMALGRPELAAALVERDGLPKIALSVLRRYQQFLDEDADLADRVGAMPRPVSLGEIMGEFDIQFIGSRQAISRQEKLQSLDRLAALGAAIPPVLLATPWQDILSWLMGEVLELPELAARIGDQSIMATNQLAMQVNEASRTGNGNGTTASPQPAAPAAQLGGGPLGL
jgi:hypothetical protein